MVDCGADRREASRACVTRIPLAGGDERRADDDGAEEEGASRSASTRGRDSRSIRHARDSTRFVVSDRHRPAPGPEEDLVTLRARPWKLAPPSVRGIHDAKLTERLIVNNAQVFEEIYRGDFFSSIRLIVATTLFCTFPGTKKGRE